MIPRKSYRVMTDLVIWFGLWDDMIERLADDTAAAESLRVSTKDFIRTALGLADGKKATTTVHPLIQSFQPIAAEACTFYSKGTPRRN